MTFENRQSSRQQVVEHDASDRSARPCSVDSVQQVYGTGSLTLLVIASMIGTGVFTTSGFTLGTVGSPWLVVMCWAIGGVVACCGAVAYGRLVQLIPESGGEYLYLARNVHPLVGFLAGWISLTAGFSGAIAAAAVAFEQYAIPEHRRPVWLPPDVVAIGVILLCATVHGLQIARGRRLQNAVVTFKLVVLASFLIAAAVRAPSHVWHTSPAVDVPAAGWPLTLAISMSLVWISLSYAGFNAAIYLASESSNARRTVPRALLIGTGAVTGLYLVLNLVFVTAAPGAQTAWKEPVAAIAASAIGGNWFEQTIRLAVCLGLLTSVSGMILTGPRVYARMADDGVFPAVFSSSRDGIRRSVGLQAGIAIGLILLQRTLVATGLLTSSLLGLLTYLGTTLSVSSACCVATLFLPSVRRQLPDSNLFADVAALVYVACTLAAVALMIADGGDDGSTWTGGLHIAGAAITVLSGLVAWKCVRRMSTRAS